MSHLIGQQGLEEIIDELVDSISFNNGYEVLRPIRLFNPQKFTEKLLRMIEKRGIDCIYFIASSYIITPEYFRPIVFSYGNKIDFQKLIKFIPTHKHLKVILDYLKNENFVRENWKTILVCAANWGAEADAAAKFLFECANFSDQAFLNHLNVIVKEIPHAEVVRAIFARIKHKEAIGKFFKNLSEQGLKQFDCIHHIAFLELYWPYLFSHVPRQNLIDALCNWVLDSGFTLFLNKGPQFVLLLNIPRIVVLFPENVDRIHFLDQLAKKLEEKIASIAPQDRLPQSLKAAFNSKLHAITTHRTSFLNCAVAESEFQKKERWIPKIKGKSSCLINTLGSVIFGSA